MTYTLEAFIEKIGSPVIVEYKGNETVFQSGKAAVDSKWQEKMRIVSIMPRGNAIVLKMEQVGPMPKITWVGEENIEFN